jgi:predicted phage terminase large subunit-like protein
MTTVDLANPNPTTRGNSDPDYCVFTTAGFDSDGRCDVLSVHRSRFNQEELCDMFFLIQKRWPANLRFKVQKDHYANALEPMMKREMAKRKEWLNIEYAPISTTISKVWKIQQLQGWFKMGNIRFANNISCKQHLIDEILRFPRGAHDDILDTISDLFFDKDKRPIAQVYPNSERTFAPHPAVKQFEGFNPESGVPMWHGDLIPESPWFDSVTGL